MKMARRLSPALVALTVSSMMLSSTFAAQPQLRELSNSPRVSHVALGQGGVLTGHVVSAERKPIANRRVEVRFQGTPIAAVLTDKNGRFEIRGLKAGLHSIESGTHSQPYQLWAPRTAPPSAQKFAVILGDAEEIVRGQGGTGGQLGAVAAGALIGAGTYWALDYNSPGS